MSNRIALVIGNSAYQQGPLKNPVNDAALITARLEALGYEIVGGASTDLNPTGMNDGANPSRSKTFELIQTFLDKIKGGATAVIYYAGHAMQVFDKNYLMPVDATFQSPDPRLELVEIKPRIEQAAERAGGEGTVVVFLDACRDNPLTDDEMRAILSRWVASAPPVEHGQREPVAATRGGLASVKLDRGSTNARTFIGFATAPGDVAFDGPKGSTNSPFAEALGKHLATRGLEIEELYNRVQTDVLDTVAAMKRHQDPWSESNLNRSLYLHPRSGWPIVVLGLGGLLAGLLIGLGVFGNGNVVKPAPLWTWGLGLLFGLVAAGGTYRWGSGGIRDVVLALIGPGIGFALALAILQTIPEMAQTRAPTAAGASHDLATGIYWAVTIGGGVLYLLGTMAVRIERRQPWPSSPLGWLNWAMTWLLPVIIVVVLLRLQYYLSASSPQQTSIAMFAVLGGVIYTASVALSCRGQGGLFSQFGPFTGAVTVGLLMAAFFAFSEAIGARHGTQDSQLLIVALGALWHMLLGAQLGYCFTYYVPDHRTRAR